MATQTLILQNFAALFPCRPRAAAALRRPPTPTAALHRPPTPTAALHRPHTPTAAVFRPKPLSLRFTHAPSLSRRNTVAAVRASASPQTLTDALNPTPSLLTGSTRTVTTLLAIVLAASRALASRILTLALPLKGPIVNSVGPAFFAAAGDEAAGSLNTPFTVVAAGMAKWLDIYSGVLMVRVLLSWFPNIPWERQPFSAVRDLCDPYLNLFRNIIPPIFDTLDVSPLLAFAVLGTLGSILKSSGAGF